MTAPRSGALVARDWMVVAAMSPVTLISSDGHVAARMADHRPYLESAYLEDFDAFLIEYAKHGVVTFDATNVADRLDPDAAAEWQKNVSEQGRLDAAWNPEGRPARAKPGGGAWRGFCPTISLRRSCCLRRRMPPRLGGPRRPWTSSARATAPTTDGWP